MGEKEAMLMFIFKLLVASDVDSFKFAFVFMSKTDWIKTAFWKAFIAPIKIALLVIKFKFDSYFKCC